MFNKMQKIMSENRVKWPFFVCGIKHITNYEIDVRDVVFEDHAHIFRQFYPKIWIGLSW